MLFNNSSKLKPPQVQSLGWFCCQTLCACSCILKIAEQYIAENKKEFDAIGVKLFGYLVAGIGFEPMTFGLWARRAARLLHPAPETSILPFLVSPCLAKWTVTPQVGVSYRHCNYRVVLRMSISNPEFSNSSLLKPVEIHGTDEHPKKSLPLIMLAAIGLVFGDIGTSPLYALK